MRSNFKAALLAAIPFEVVNFWLVGYPAGTSGLSSSSQSAGLALQWYVFHLPGIIASDRSIFLRAHPVVCSLLLMLTGYIDTVLFLWAVIWATRLTLHTLRRLSFPMKHAH